MRLLILKIVYATYLGYLLTCLVMIPILSAMKFFKEDWPEIWDTLKHKTYLKEKEYLKR